MRRKDSAMDVRGIITSQAQAEEGPAGHTLNLTVLGVCTGTGLDHLDCALVRFGQNSPSSPLCVELQQFDKIPVPSSVRTPIVEYLRSDRRTTEPAALLHSLVGRLFSGGIKTFCRKHALDPVSIDLVGAHSEALKLLDARAHLNGAGEHPSHWNAIVAAKTGISIVSGFTIIERAVVQPHIHPTSYVDRLFLRHPTRFRVCLNLDELANLSFIPAHSDDGARATISRDVGPGSLLIDYAMRYCTSNHRSEDHDGELGSMGKVNQTIVDRFLHARDYLRQSPPMNIATEMFGDHEAQQLVDDCLYNSMSEADTIATVTRVTSQNILRQYQRLLQLFFPPDQQVHELFICGPSTRNSNIVDYLEDMLPESVITKPLHDIGIPGDAHEAVCYAHLALEALLSQVTQAANTSLSPSSAYPNADAIRANIITGIRWDNVLSHVLAFSGGQKLHVTTHVRIAGSLEADVQSLNIREA